MSKPDRTKLIKGIIKDVFQFQRLDDLADQNPFVAITYAQLVAHINYAILRIGGEGVDEHITIAGITFDGSTLQGKVNACAEAFRHMANKLDDVLSTTNISSILTAIQAGEIARTAIGATRLSVKQQYKSGRPKP